MQHKPRPLSDVVYLSKEQLAKSLHVLRPSLLCSAVVYLMKEQLAKSLHVNLQPVAVNHFSALDHSVSVFVSSEDYVYSLARHHWIPR